MTGQELDDYYTEYEGYNNDPQDHVISCYVCTYHVRQGHTSGMSSCRDPFDKFGIPEVECTGACAVSISFLYCFSLVIFKLSVFYMCTF